MQALEEALADPLGYGGQPRLWTANVMLETTLLVCTRA